MRILSLSLALCALLVSGCEEPFTPKTPFVSRPVVTCIVSGTNSGYSVSATVTRTYDVSGLDPIANTIDPFDTSASVVLTLNGDPDTLRLFRQKRADTSRYATKLFTFRTARIIPYFSTPGLMLSVRMGDGKKLSAACTAPQARLIGSSHRFVAGATPWTSEPLWTFDWDNDQRADHLYFPKLLLSYTIMRDSVATSKQLEIPLRYVEKDGKLTAVYPSFTRALHLTYDLSALERAVASISEGDSVKSRYKIGLLTFSLIEYDTHLSNYYSSSHGYLDEYSIRVDETTYSNIGGGGIGIFGSSFTNQLMFEINARFIKTFGYQL